MEMLKNIAMMKHEELIASLKDSKEREVEMLARKEKVTPQMHGNRKERRAYQSQLRKQKREFA